MSEMELSLFRQRSLEALKQKARRGELFMTVAVGYLKVRHDRIERDPDRRIQEAISLVFSKFADVQTVRSRISVLTQSLRSTGYNLQRVHSAVRGFGF